MSSIKRKSYDIIIYCLSHIHWDIYKMGWFHPYEPLVFVSVWSMNVFTDTPHKPTLSSDNKDPQEGQSLTLTCTTITNATRYQFFKNSKELGQRITSNTFTINPAHLSIYNGYYNCKAFVGDVVSELSERVEVSG